MSGEGEPDIGSDLAAYSLRDYFSFMKGKRQAAGRLGQSDRYGRISGLLRQPRIRSGRIDQLFLSARRRRVYFLELKRQAFFRGLTISGTAIGNNFTQGAGEKMEPEIQAAMGWIDKAALMGAPHIRFFAGKGKELDDHPERMDEAVDAMKRCAERAGQKGVFLGIENHGNLRPDQLLQIIHAVDNPGSASTWIPAIFISDDPYGDLEKCVPFAVNVQVKVSMKKPDGTKYPADFDRIAAILRNSNYQGFVILEYEDEDPLDTFPAAADRLRKGPGRLIGPINNRSSRRNRTPFP